MAESRHEMRDTRYKKGFTLVELLVALMVTSIVLGAVASLAFAFSSANDTASDASTKQAQIRFATLQISELIRKCKLVCATPNNNIVIWKADDSPSNSQIDVVELAYIEKGSGSNYLKIVEFESCQMWLESWFRDAGSQLLLLRDISYKDLFISKSSTVYKQLIPTCSNVKFTLDTAAPWSRSVGISFDIEMDGVSYNYQINTALRASGTNLVDTAGLSIVGDDD